MWSGATNHRTSTSQSDNLPEVQGQNTLGDDILGRGGAVQPSVHGATWEPGRGLSGSLNDPLAVLTLTSLTLTELGPPAHTGGVLRGAKPPM